MRARLTKAFDQFHDVQDGSDGDVAMLIRDLQTDIAVDLAVDVQPRRVLALEQELLNAPVQKLGDKQHVGRRAGHLVNPAELLQSFAGSAEHSQ